MDAEIPTAFADNEGRVERLLADIDALEGVLQDYKTVIGNDVLSRIEHIGVSARNELLVESDYLSRLGEFEELLELRRRSLDKELGALVSEVMKER